MRRILLVLLGAFGVVLGVFVGGFMFAFLLMVRNFILSCSASGSTVLNYCRAVLTKWLVTWSAHCVAYSDSEKQRKYFPVNYSYCNYEEDNVIMKLC